jgi:hypothetical protein
MLKKEKMIKLRELEAMKLKHNFKSYKTTISEMKTIIVYNE